MAALKTTIDDTVEVIGPLRDFYSRGADGKFHLALDGEPPGFVKADKLAEFRSKNVALMKEVDELRPLKAKYEGIDAEEYKALKAKAAAGDGEAVAELKSQLAREQSARAEAQHKADALLLRHTVGGAFLAMGGQPEAVDYIVGKAPFVVADGEVQPKDGAVSVEEWLVGQSTASAFAFKPSSGGGARPRSSVLGAWSSPKELRDPTPQQLGQHASEIASGKLKVVFTNS